ncbi:hypothetical protein QYH60_13425 (plasmid) [Lactococcus lactis subsp. lactis]|uniref:hypothetical protein n=1 Tax=Lactococcus lactis TaxID=1358 RepID=UPI00264A2B93|nr:hypothetical protein [Lactococcus lactis]WKB49873.1 hypothetical protein QYH60_13425 [Lactococcus lactis subsp. lactis]
MKYNLEKLQKLIRSPSGNLLFALSSLIFVSVILIAIVTVLLSGTKAEKTAQPPSKTVVIRKSTGIINSSKSEPASSNPSSQPRENQETKATKSLQATSKSEAPPTPQSTVPTTVQSVPTPSSSTCPPAQSNEAQALREAQLKQEAENKKEAERLKAEYEGKGYQVNIIVQEGE